MRRALLGLRVRPGARADRRRPLSVVRRAAAGCSFEAIVDGDARRICIGAASILAKVTRDAMMVGLDAIYPQYGFASHKGYCTPEHFEALDKLRPVADPSPQLRAGARQRPSLRDRHRSRLPLRCSVHLHLHTEYSLVDSVVRIQSEGGDAPG